MEEGELAATDAGGDEARSLPVATGTHRGRLLQASGRCSVGDVFCFDMTVATWLRREQPHHTVVSEGADGVDERVDEVAVFVSPPQEHDIDDVVVVVIHHLDALSGQEAVAQPAIGVIVDADLPDHVSGLNPEQRQACLAVGAHRGTPREDTSPVRSTALVQRTPASRATNSGVLTPLGRDQERRMGAA